MKQKFEMTLQIWLKAAKTDIQKINWKTPPNASTQHRFVYRLNLGNKSVSYTIYDLLISTTFRENICNYIRLYVIYCTFKMFIYFEMFNTRYLSHTIFLIFIKVERVNCVRHCSILFSYVKYSIERSSQYSIILTSKKILTLRPF